jgi:hypothetical protein
VVRLAQAASDKAARRHVILDAAIETYVASNGALPSVQATASAAGLAKGTVYLLPDQERDLRRDPA